MPRTYKRKTDRHLLNENDMIKAIKSVVEGQMLPSEAAKVFGVNIHTLRTRIKKTKKTGNTLHSLSRGFANKHSSQQVFTADQEKELNKYLIRCSKLHYGLSIIQTRKLAYDYAKKLKIPYPASWDKKNAAGVDWMKGFRNRNPGLSLRKPENTSAARGLGFTKKIVMDFYALLESAYTRFHFPPNRIFNLDETGITTVVEGPKVFAEKSSKQVGQFTSRERGELVTFCGIVSASGTVLPPVFVFPRVHLKESMLEGAPVGTVGLSNPSGWMTSDLFISVLIHIQKHTSCTVENPILVLMDNHESHVSLKAIEYCRSNGIVVISFPPHTSHKLQPLDVSVYSSFKSKLKISIRDWHINNVGKVLTIHKVADLSRNPFFEAFSARNIINGFAKPGIWPLNRLAFSDDDFAPSSILENTNVPTEQSPNSCPNVSLEVTQVSVNPEDFSTNKISPEVVRPLPKATTSAKKSNRVKGRARIYTDSPEKAQMEKLEAEKIRKKNEKEAKQKAKELANAKKLLGLQTPKKKKIKTTK